MRNVKMISEYHMNIHTSFVHHIMASSLENFYYKFPLCIGAVNDVLMWGLMGSDVLMWGRSYAMSMWRKICSNAEKSAACTVKPVHNSHSWDENYL